MNPAACCYQAGSFRNLRKNSIFNPEEGQPGELGQADKYMMLSLVFAEIMEDSGSKFRKIVDKQIHLLMINDAKKNRAR